MINVIDEHDITMVEVYGYLIDYQRAATKSAIYPGVGTLMGLSYVLHKLAGEAGEANEHFGKAQRDDGLFDLMLLGDAGGCNVYQLKQFPLTPERREALLKEIGDILWYLSAACNELDTTLQKVAVANLRKLRDRQLRNVQQGSGDAR